MFGTYNSRSGPQQLRRHFLALETDSQTATIYSRILPFAGRLKLISIVKFFVYT